MTTKRKKKNALGPSPSVLDGCAKQIDHLIALIGQGRAPLTVTEKQHFVRLRTGGGDVVRSIAALATKHGADGDPASGMLDGIAYGERLVQLAAQAKLLGVLLGDLVLKVHGGTWRSAMLTYSILQARGALDPRIAHDLEPVAKVLSTREARRRNQAAKLAAAKASAKEPSTTEAPAADAAAK